jgi:glutaconate CoA-transferase subunit A
MPVRGIVGSDYLRVRPDFKILTNPYGSDEIVVVPAIVPDVAVFHAFRADRTGNILADRNQDNWLLAQAARIVIVTVEELVDDGNLVTGSFDPVISAIHITAIVHATGGAHPTGCPGYYHSSQTHLREYLASARDDASFAAYLDRYVRVDETHYQRLVNSVAEEEAQQ